MRIWSDNFIICLLHFVTSKEKTYIYGKYKIKKSDRI